MSEMRFVVSYYLLWLSVEGRHQDHVSGLTRCGHSVTLELNSTTLSRLPLVQKWIGLVVQRTYTLGKVSCFMTLVRRAYLNLLYNYNYFRITLIFLVSYIRSTEKVFLCLQQIIT